LLAFCVSVGRGIVIRNKKDQEGANMKTSLLILTAGAAALFGPALHAENYPSKPITLVAVFGPGSASDTICRVIAQPLGVALKETVIVEDRPGANGALAALYVAHAAADGHTLLMATNSPLSAVPFLMRNVSYDPVKDFTPVTRVGSFTLMLVVNPSVPAKTVKELIEYAKDHPGKLSFASANTSGIVAGETLKHWAEIDMLHVPYKSSPPAIQDVLAGRVSMMFTDLTTGLPHVRSGALRALAVTRLARSSLIPELPTLDEAGVTGFDMDSWAGIVAPAHTPAAIVTQLNTELRKIIDSPDIKSTLGKVGFEAFSSSPREFDNFINVQLGKWGKMVKDAGIQPE
jgi:tripartite-type tricarboxylate transporter receptor subunit TctC